MNSCIISFLIGVGMFSLANAGRYCVSLYRASQDISKKKLYLLALRWGFNILLIASIQSGIIWFINSLFPHQDYLTILSGILALSLLTINPCKYKNINHWDTF